MLHPNPAETVLAFSSGSASRPAQPAAALPSSRLPLGFALVWLQGLSEIIKRIGYLRGVHNMDLQYERPLQ